MPLEMIMKFLENATNPKDKEYWLGQLKRFHIDAYNTLMQTAQASAQPTANQPQATPPAATVPAQGATGPTPPPIYGPAEPPKPTEGEVPPPPPRVTLYPNNPRQGEDAQGNMWYYDMSRMIWDINEKAAPVPPPKNEADRTRTVRIGNRIFKEYWKGEPDAPGSQLLLQDDIGEFKPEPSKKIIRNEIIDGQEYEVERDPVTGEILNKVLTGRNLTKTATPRAKGAFDTPAEARAAYPDTAKYNIELGNDGLYYVVERPYTEPKTTSVDTRPGELALAQQRLEWEKAQAAQDAADRLKALQWEATRTSGEQVNKYGMWAVENAAQEARDKSAKALATQKMFMDYANRLQDQANITRQEANTMAWNQQQARQFAETQKATAAEEQRRYGAQLAANPASWIQSNVYQGTTPMVQPWMGPLGLTNVGQPVPTVQTRVPYNPPGPATFVSEVGTGNLTQAEINKIMTARTGAGPYPPWNTSVGPGFAPESVGTLSLQERSATGLARATEASMSADIAEPWTPKTTAPLLQPSAQAWARMSPTDLEMYGSYEKGRTGLTLEDLRNRMWATATPGASGGGARRRTY